MLYSPPPRSKSGPGARSWAICHRISSKPRLCTLTSLLTRFLVDNNNNSTNNCAEKPKNDIVVKCQSSSTSGSWLTHDSDIFGTDDSILFHMQELGSCCAFHVRNANVCKKMIIEYFTSQLSN